MVGAAPIDSPSARQPLSNSESSSLVLQIFMPDAVLLFIFAPLLSQPQAARQLSHSFKDGVFRNDAFHDARQTT